jgi:hypothetical protein
MPRRVAIVRPSRGRGGARLALALGLAVVLLPSAWALHRETPGAVRITSGGPHLLSPSRSWGNYLAFSSPVDLLLTGSTARQVYVWNLADFDCNRGTSRRLTPCSDPPRPSLVQATDTERLGNPDNPSVNREGTLVVFDADGAHGGGTGFQAQRRQIFQLDLTTRELFQITSSGAGDSTQPTINKFSNVVTFVSTAPLLGPSGPPGVPQVFVLVQPLFTDQKKLLQLTAGQGPSGAPMPDSTGTRVVFESRADLLGDGHDTGIWQIFVADIDREALTFTLFQITDGNGDSRRPYLSGGNANRAAFESVATDFPDTAGGGSQIYSAQVNEGNFPPIAQHTNQAQFGNCTSPTVDTLAKHIAFICTGDPLQNGTTGNRLFSLSTDDNVLFQLTGRGDVKAPLAHSLGVFFVAFAGNADLSATSPTFGNDPPATTGACDYQLQVLVFYDQQPGLPVWQGATQIGELPPDLLPPPVADPSDFPPPTSNFLGTHFFDVLPGDGVTGSRLRITGTSGSSFTGIPGGELLMQLSPHVNGVADVSIPKDGVRFGAIPLPGGGLLCVDEPQDGNGIVDCKGGFAGADLQVTVDHDTRDVDPACQLGCAEDAPCQGPFSGLHRQPCASCPGGTVSLCNGPVRTVRTGALEAGGLVVRLPLKLSVTLDAGIDNVHCTRDDEYQFEDVNAALLLTTGTSRGVIADVDAIPGSTLAPSASQGSELDCDVLQDDNVTPLRLVGSLPLLDVPGLGTFGDLVLDFELETRSRPLHPTAENFLGDVSCQAGPCTSPVECDDGNVCNGAETCNNGACAPGAPLCDDGDPCNGVEACDPGTGACTPGTPPVCDDGSVCTFDTCLPTQGCLFISTCDDGNACNGIESCDPATGACGPGTPPVCNDANPCTDDFCDPAFGCGITFNTLPCNDGSLCTFADTCQAGQCLGTPNACSDNNACNGVETCNPATGACLPGTPLVCDDGNPCTNDSCDTLFGCLHTNNFAPCSDSNACTTGDVCANGVCTGTPTVVCNDGNFCNGTETCVPATGLCQPGSPLACTDGNPCTDDSCAPATGCVFTPNTDPCDDGDICTFNDACNGTSGLCIGIPVLCSDGNLCNGTEFCDPGTAACQPGPPLNCDDGDACTLDSCDGVAGCEHLPIAGCTLTRLTQDVLPVMKLMVADAPPSSIGGRDLQRTLDRLVERARARIRGAIGQPPAVARRRVAAAERRLRRFLVIVETGRATGRITDTLAEDLTRRGENAITELRALLDQVY